MVQKSKKMFSRLPNKKIINFIMVKGKKACAEFLIKKSFKLLIKNNKKQFKKIIYLSVNYCLPTFKFQIKKTFFKRQRLIQLKPSLINTIHYRIFCSLKIICDSAKKNYKKKTFIENLENEFISVLFLNSSSSSLIKAKLNQKEILNNQNVLTFYRWF